MLAVPGHALPPGGPPPRRLRAAALALLGALAAVAVLLHATWPRPLAFALDQAGLLGPGEELELPDEPSLVVLPFESPSRDPEDQRFADGLVADLATALARIPRLFVFARNTAFTYRDGPVDARTVGRELGVRYAVEGSVRRSGGRVRVNVQLIETETAHPVFSERLERDSADLFALESELVARILKALSVQVLEAEVAPTRAVPTKDLSAYQAATRAGSHLHGGTFEDVLAARRLLERALQLDPNYGEAWAGLAITHFTPFAQGWDLDPRGFERAENFARRALGVDARIPETHVAMAAVAFYRGESAAALEHAERAVALGPARDMAHFWLGNARLGAGDRLGALRAFSHALRLNPRAGWACRSVLGSVRYRLGQSDEAVAIWEHVRAAAPSDTFARTRLIAHYHETGDHERARAIVREILALNPAYEVGVNTPETARKNFPEATARLERLLREAGLP